MSSTLTKKHNKRCPIATSLWKTLDATYFHFKTDILSGRIIYSMDKRMAVNLVTISSERAIEVIALNKEGEKPEHSTMRCDLLPRN